jgi:hypothetical protein
MDLPEDDFETIEKPLVSLRQGVERKNRLLSVLALVCAPSLQ